ncbi:C-X-C motif chemokine 16 [Tachyglossus aculeatus]|uniref:C-X-C motif chemokine 16 n=1 Tax=Tachyglossus aculeatus TaxID=9261 RepID=UPI0018F36BFA|nr:C-X-C motif chemokine 16 [Tachyglossus aculeatus]
MWGLRGLPLLLLLLLPLANGNESSLVGACTCNVRVSTPPEPRYLEVLTSHLRHYQLCHHSYVRFHLPRRTLCGNAQAAWVKELMSCFDQGACGSRRTEPAQEEQRLKSQAGPAPAQTQAPVGGRTTAAPTTLLSTTVRPSSPPPAPPGSTWLPEETVAFNTASQARGDGPDPAGHKEAEARGLGRAVVPVLGLLGVVFVLTAVLAYVVCRRRGAPRNEMLYPQRPRAYHLPYHPCQAHALDPPWDGHPRAGPGPRAWPAPASGNPPAPVPV